MTKMMFLLSLHDRLSDLPQEDVEERLYFYSEMIEDRMEEGLSEEEAVAAVGSVEEIAAQIEADISTSKPGQEKIKPKRQLKAWEIVLLAVGSPLWLSLLTAVVVFFLSLYISLWSVIICLWAVFGTAVGCSLGGVIAGVGFVMEGNITAGIAMIGMAIACAGLSILLFIGSKLATKGVLLLTKKIALCIKKCFAKKEEV